MAMVLQKRRVGFALFKGIHEPIEWGMPKFEDINGCFDEARTLLHNHSPAVLVLPATDTRRSRLPKCVHEVVDRIASDAAACGIEVVRFNRDDVRTYFAMHGAKTKQEIAEIVGKIIPVFARCVPRPRKMWEGERHSMILFDALSLIVTFYRTVRQQPNP